MGKATKYQSVLPEGWHALLFKEADLEASFNALDGLTHFYCEAMRGRIRSFQMRIDDAWDHLDRATELADKAPVNVPNLARQFLMNIYLFENALLSGPVDRSAPAPDLMIPTLPDKLLKEYPEVKLALDLRLIAEGCIRLHLGDYHVASTLFQGLIDSYSKGPDAILCNHYLGLAAAQYNLGLENLYRKTLENAGLALQAGGDTLNKAKAAGMMSSFYAFLDDKEAAEDWKAFLQRLPCPQETKDAFLRRGDLLLERSLETKCLLVF